MQHHTAQTHDDRSSAIYGTLNPASTYLPSRRREACPAQPTCRTTYLARRMAPCAPNARLPATLAASHHISITAPPSTNTKLACAHGCQEHHRRRWICCSSPTPGPAFLSNLPLLPKHPFGIATTSHISRTARKEKNVHPCTGHSTFPNPKSNLRTNGRTHTLTTPPTNYCLCSDGR